MLEGRQFTIYTDHKPLTFAFRQKADKASPRQSRQLEFISQFTTTKIFAIDYNEFTVAEGGTSTHMDTSTATRQVTM